MTTMPCRARYTCRDLLIQIGACERIAPVAEESIDSRQVVVAVRGLMVAADAYRRGVADAYGINVADVITLGDLYHFGPMSPRSIAERLAWTTGGVTALLDRLERAEYAHRVPHPTDRRSVIVQLTPLGAQITQNAFQILESTVAQAAKDHDTDVETLTVFLESTTTALQQAANDHSEIPDSDSS